MTPRQSLAAARHLQREGLLGRAGPRSEALLLRSAIEGALSDWLAMEHPGAQTTSFAVQLQVLQARFPDPDLADRIAWTWTALSRATHFHGYELPPDRRDLELWEEAVERFLDAVHPSGARV